METATTSAPFVPALAAAHAPAHGLEGRRRSAQARQRFRFGDSTRSAPACDLHEEMTERIVEFLNMRQHSHRAASCSLIGGAVHAVLDVG
jgi:hypothetical protein